ncbi:MAG: hypothetical protein Q7R39_15115, partial [Dehalococcoidia bacterium]|nr:hypothetical protein [Dehalococcoidia bacterium]
MPTRNQNDGPEDRSGGVTIIADGIQEHFLPCAAHLLRPERPSGAVDDFQDWVQGALSPYRGIQGGVPFADPPPKRRRRTLNPLSGGLGPAQNCIRSEQARTGKA